MTTGAPSSLDTTRPRWWWQTAMVLSRHPSLWCTAVRQVFVLAAPGWWRRPPFLPRPDARYMRFRLSTAYGDPNCDPDPADVVTYLHWCRTWPEWARARNG